MVPVNNLVTPMLTDLYQITMAYAYWKSKKTQDRAVFDLFFRKNPLQGEFTIFAGLEEVLRLLDNFKFTDEHIAYLKDGQRISKETLCQRFEEGLDVGYVRKHGSKYEQLSFNGGTTPEWYEIEPPHHSIDVAPPMASCEPEFFKWLENLDCSEITVKSFREGSVVFPREPLLRVEGPIAVAQLLETPLLTLVNYPSLVATKAARLRIAAGYDKRLLEFGLRRAQGPDGGVSASRYSYIGGFDATSNVIAGEMFGIPIAGTHAHSFISSFSHLEDLTLKTLVDKEGKRSFNLAEKALKYREELNFTSSNEGELVAFISYAISFPDSFLALIDTYDILKSGAPNYICVALALADLGYRPLGIRIDSGDLAYFSKKVRAMFKEIDKIYNSSLGSSSIVASNDIDESTLNSLTQQGHEIDTFGIGTNLVTVNGQPSLGGVYKLVSINGNPRIKISQDISKITIPGAKTPYRLYGDNHYPILDLMIQDDEAPPESGKKILCRHPFKNSQRAYVIPSDVELLHHCCWQGRRMLPPEPLCDVRSYALKQMASLREDHLRNLNPTPYKISVSEKLFMYITQLWEEETPIPTLIT